MKYIVLFILLFFMCMAILVGGVSAKDLSRVPAKGDAPSYAISIEVCDQKMTVKKRKRQTILHLSRTNCRYIPAWHQGKLKVSWSNVFREMQRARECGIPVFSTEECNG